MSNETVLNPEANATVINPEANATVINPQVSQATLLNPDLTATGEKLPAGTLLGGKYQILEAMSVTAGEADLYLCSYDEKTYVIKLYRRQRAIKPEVIAALRSIESPYIAALVDNIVFVEHMKRFIEAGDDGLF